MIDVVVVDDHPVVRRGVVELISEQAGMHVIREYGEIDELVRDLPAIPAGVLVVDISLGTRTSLQTLGLLTRRRPDLRAVVFTIHSKAQYEWQAARYGASAYVTKDSEPEVLIDAIRCVESGESCLSPELSAGDHADHGRATEALPHARLSPRELQVMRMLAAGWSVSEIAEELSLSVKTVSTYRSRVLEKMHFEFNTQIVQYSVDHGLL